MESMFIQKVNNVTGQTEWVVKDKHYDLAQEIARSRFADMILDFDRNEMFYEGLKTVIADVRKRHSYVHVLDIGTGTGLLAMMAAELGADKVTALEVFNPMAKCARHVVDINKMSDKINIISSRSTEIQNIAHEDQKPNVIVAEVFDTELIGEGALRTFRDALKNLVTPDCRVVPSLGRLWITPVQSSLLSRFTCPPRLPGEDLTSLDAEDNPLAVSCPDSSAVFDCQISQIDPCKFTSLSEPTLAFEFDFESLDSIKFDESYTRTVRCQQSGKVDAFFVWWDLDMDRKGENLIDMAPKWSRHALKSYEWRDHWMQAIYFPANKNLHFEEGQDIRILCSHDEYSLWFDVASSSNAPSVPRPYCICTMHNYLTRYNIYRMHAIFENVKFTEFVFKTCYNKTVICLGEGSLVGLLAAKSARKVLIVDKNKHFREIIEKYKQYYQLLNITLFETIAQLPETIEDATKDSSSLTVLAEPFYLTAINPLAHMRYAIELEQIEHKYNNYTVKAYPTEANLYMLPMCFTHLQKIASPVGTIRGFDLSAFDDLSFKARQATDTVLDEQHVWEYEARADGEPVHIRKWDTADELVDVYADAVIPLKKETNGIVMWLEWGFSDSVTLSTGLLEQPSLWHKGYKQGIYFLPPSQLGLPSVKLSMIYIGDQNIFDFEFKNK